MTLPYEKLRFEKNILVSFLKKMLAYCVILTGIVFSAGQFDDLFDLIVIGKLSVIFHTNKFFKFCILFDNK